jgi:hypothetical protein
MSANRGIFALDPGGSSGLAWGIFDVSPNTPVAESLKKGQHKGSTTIEGEEHDQIEAIFEVWARFYATCVHVGCLDPTEVEFVSEDFVQRPGSSGGKEGNSPIRVMWGVEGYRMGRAAEFKGRKKSKSRVHAPRMILQMPGDASSFGTSARLKEWDCWVVGREHERSAWKHIGLRVAKVQQIRKTHA